jgi:hypothetical protein
MESVSKYCLSCLVNPNPPKSQLIISEDHGVDSYFVEFHLLLCELIACGGMSFCDFWCKKVVD